MAQKTKVPVYDSRNDGQSIAVIVRPNANGSATFEANLTQLAAPAEVFTADTIDIQERLGAFRIAFSMSRLYGTGPRALVEVVMSESAGRGFRKSLHELSRKEGPTAALTPLVEEPINTVALVANFVRISSNETGSVIDYYFASPFSVDAAVKTGTISFRDVVRIKCDERIFFALVKFFMGRFDE